jgi:hypothetical protein
MLATEALLGLMNPNPAPKKELPGIQCVNQMLSNFYMELDPGENDYYVTAVQAKKICNPVIIKIKNMKRSTFILGMF